MTKMLFTILTLARDIEVFQICKLATCCHTLNQILTKYDEKDISANLNQKCLILCSKIPLNVLREQA